MPRRQGREVLRSASSLRQQIPDLHGFPPGAEIGDELVVVGVDLVGVLVGDGFEMHGGGVVP